MARFNFLKGTLKRGHMRGYRMGQLWNWDRELGFYRSKKSSFKPKMMGGKTPYVGLVKKGK